MVERLLLLTFVFVAMVALPAGAQAQRVTVTTSLGKIVLELDAAKAPKSVENFLSYVDSGFYDGTIFHRVIPNFMIQGGGFTKDMQRKTTREAVINEAKNGLKNERGTVAMARLPQPHTATSQFFINSKSNDFLNQPASETEWGYAVFGRVVEGMEVVDAISAVKTATRSGNENVPVETVVIESVKRNP